MEILDWLFVGLLSAAILFVLLAILFFVIWIKNSGKLKKNRKRRPSKRNKKKWMRLNARFKKRAQKARNRFVLILVLAGVFFAGGFYIRYYQSTNLDVKDQEALVQGYFIIDELEQRIEAISDTDNPQKDLATIYDLSARLANYGARVPNSRLSKEGKVIMSQLFDRMKRLGLNLSGISLKQLQEEEIRNSYIEDISKVQGSQEKAFEFYRIKESSLKK